MSRIGAPVLLILVLVIGLQNWANPEGAAEVWDEVPLVGAALDTVGLGGDPDWDTVAGDIEPHLRYIDGTGCDGVQSGLGFVVGGYVLTAAHLMDGGDEVEVATPGASAPRVQRVPASIDPNHDLAWAQVSADLVGLQVDTATPDVGDPVLLAARGRSGVEFTAGRVHLHLDDGGYGYVGPLLLVEAETEPGFSGGPVITESGEVAAMVVARDQVTGLALAVPGSELASLDFTHSGRPSACGA